jgi:hypothetical protein
MPDPPTDEFSYRSFSDLLTGYRLSAVLMQAHAAGLFEVIGRQGIEGPEVCARLGWEPVYGGRFLQCLCGLGLLLRDESGRYRPAPFAAAFFCPGSPQYQGNTLAFEQQLHESWSHLAATLRAGERIFATRDKDPEELRRAFSVFLGAMDEAARVRAAELWDWLPVAAQQGVILDAGAGSGAFLLEFFTRYPAWSGVFCDLPEVVADSGLHRRLAGLEDRLRWCGCNLLAPGPSDFDQIDAASCDLVLLSNIIHCQGAGETEGLLSRTAGKMKGRGMLVVHDFFSDVGRQGALYDIHMMLNTFNGRTYTLKEIAEMASSFGLCHSISKQLPSGSVALILAREAGVLPAGR